MRKLTTTFSLSVALLLGSAINVFAESLTRNKLVPLEGQQIIGNYGYDKAFTDFKILLESPNHDEIELNLQFEHSLNNFKNTKEFRIRIPSCDLTFRVNSGFLKSLQIYEKSALEICHLIENTKSTIKKYRFRNRYEISFSNPTYGNSKVSLNYSSNYNEMKFHGNLNFFINPNLNKFNSLAGKISFDSMSGEIDFKTKNRKSVRTRFHIDNNKLYHTSNYGNNTESKEILIGDDKIKITKILQVIKQMLNSNENSYYFGGREVYQGELLNKKLLALQNSISADPVSVTAYEVIGKSKYRERDIIVATQIINSMSLQSSETFEIALDPENVVYIDQRTGIMSFYNIKGSFLNEGRQVLSFMMGYDTTFSKSKTLPMKDDDIIDLNKFENKCSEIGFTKGTEKYGDCVMKLLN